MAFFFKSEDLVREAAESAGMACRPVGIHLDQEGIVVAVACNRNYVLEVAACLALEPELLPGS